MKAINQYNASDTMQLSFNDIVFENRNKEYGSYDMRKRYIVSLLYALLFSLSAVTITVVCPMLYYKYFHQEAPIIISSQEPNILTTVTVDPTEIVPPPEIKAPAPSMVNNGFFIPVIVDVLEDNPPAAMPIDVPNDGQSTEKEPNGVLTGPITVDPVPIELPVEMQTFTNPEEPAMFKGGDLSSFSKWVQKQLVYPQEAIDNRIAGKVTVEFTIGLQGKIDDITIVRSMDQLLDNEVMRVLKKSPAWTEPRQGGRVVKQHFFMPVFFQIQ
jgi:protein TonB